MAMYAIVGNKMYVLFKVFCNAVFKKHWFPNGFAIVGSNMYVFFKGSRDAVFKKHYLFNAKLHDPNLGCEGMFIYKE